MNASPTKYPHPNPPPPAGEGISAGAAVCPPFPHAGEGISAGAAVCPPFPHAGEGISAGAAVCPPPPPAGEGISAGAAVSPSPACGGGPGWGSLVSEPLRAGSVELEVLRRGMGRPILLLHGVNPVSPKAAFLDELARHGEVIAPSLPGFGKSPLPAEFDSMYDLVHVCRDVLDALPDRAVVIGFSFGGWVAAEVAVGGHAKLDRLVLVDPVGVKLGGREERDIVHFFNTSPAELDRLAWHDPRRRPDGVYGLGWQAGIAETMSDAEMAGLARNWDALCLYAWRPHMYNPQLRHWLRRIAVPSQVLWGAGDRIVTPEYGRRYAALIPGARFAVIAEAGHHPELEQPRAFVERVTRFLQEPSLRGA